MNILGIASLNDTKIFRKGLSVMTYSLRQYMPFYIAMVSMVGVDFIQPTTVSAQEVFATSFFGPDASEGPSALNGLLKVNLLDGTASTFISEIYSGQNPVFAFPTDVALHPTDGYVYVSTAAATIMRFDAITGAAPPSLVPGFAPGTFAFLDETAALQDGFSTLHIEEDGTVVAGTFFGNVNSYNSGTGAELSSMLVGDFLGDAVSGLSQLSSGEILAVTGNVQAAASGKIKRIDGGTITTLVDGNNPLTTLGGSNPFVLEAPGDYDQNGVVEQNDYVVWSALYGTNNASADGNGDGFVDAADYTIWRDNLDREDRILVTDLFDNEIKSYKLDGTEGQTFAVIPPAIPNPLPPTADPNSPSNSPSEILLSEDGTLLVSLLGLTRRPDNRGAILEYDIDGNLIQTITSTLPPISGIANAPVVPAVAANSTAVPEPNTLMMLVVAGTTLLAARRRKV